MTRKAWIAAVAILILMPLTSRADFTLTLTGGSDSVTIDVSANSTFTVISNNVGITNNTLLQAGGSYGTSNQLSIASMMSGGFLYSNGQSSLIITGLTFDGYTAQFTGASSNNPGTSVIGELGLTDFNISGSSGDASSFGISVSEGGFTGPTGIRNFEGDFDSIVAPGNAQLSLSTAYSDGSGNNFSFTYTGNSTSDQTQGPFYSTSSYTLTDSVTVTGLGVNALTNVGVEAIVHAPAPSGLVYSASLVPFFGLLQRRWRGRQTVAPV